MQTSGKLFMLGIVIVTSFLLSRTAPAQGPVPNSAITLLDRVIDVYGRQWTTGEISDSIADGKLTFFNGAGAKANFEFTLFRRGYTHAQRIIKEPAGNLKQGTDGTNSWESILGFSTPTAQGSALQFLESQTSRSIPRLLNYSKEGITVRDLGVRGNERTIEAEDRKGKKTTYRIDPDKHLITELEVLTGERRDAFSGLAVPETDRYVFSDMRVIQGVLTPFKIERYNSGFKTEEMQLTTVRYNAGLKDADFRR
jgi:hypothetical protein